MQIPFPETESHLQAGRRRKSVSFLTSLCPTAAAAADVSIMLMIVIHGEEMPALLVALSSPLTAAIAAISLSLSLFPELRGSSSSLESNLKVKRQGKCETGEREREREKRDRNGTSSCFSHFSPSSAAFHTVFVV